MEGTVETKEVDIQMIQTDPEIQPRERLLPEPLRALTQLLQEDGAEAVPPVVLFHDPDDIFWLADGHYRVAAAKEALEHGGPWVLRAEVYEGTKRDAIFYACGANKHGTHLTNEEKRRAVIRLLHDDDWGQMSDNAIARHIGVSNSFVSGIHRELDSQEASLLGAKILPSRTTTAVRGGKEYPMKKGNIGRTKKTKTAPPASPPEITQDEPATDGDDEQNTTDARELGEALIAVSQRPVGFSVAQHGEDESVADLPAIATEELYGLAKAWITAPIPERREFIQWMATRSVSELGFDSEPGSIECIGDVLFEIFRTSDAT